MNILRFFEKKFSKNVREGHASELSAKILDWSYWFKITLIPAETDPTDADGAHEFQQLVE